MGTIMSHDVEAAIATFLYNVNTVSKSYGQETNAFSLRNDPAKFDAEVADLRMKLWNFQNPFKDVLVRVGETRTGSLMLGNGINSDNGLVGNIGLNPPTFPPLSPAQDAGDAGGRRTGNVDKQKFKKLVADWG